MIPLPKNDAQARVTVCAVGKFVILFKYACIYVLIVFIMTYQ